MRMYYLQGKRARALKRSDACTHQPTRQSPLSLGLELELPLGLELRSCARRKRNSGCDLSPRARAPGSTLGGGTLLPMVSGISGIPFAAGLGDTGYRLPGDVLIFSSLTGKAREKAVS